MTILALLMFDQMLVVFSYYRDRKTCYLVTYEGVCIYVLYVYIYLCKLLEGIFVDI